MSQRNHQRKVLFGFGALILGASVGWAQLGDRTGDDPQRPPSQDIDIPPAPVLSAAEALQSFVLPAGFRAEVVASEPLVHDPVMAVFDPQGRLWVAELSAYNAEILTELPEYLEKAKPIPPRPVGRVVVLEDTDRDGVMDRRTVYWDNLNVPRAIAFTRDQVIIGDPPNLWLTRDRDGDNVMDEKQLLTDDYGTPENVEASPNGLLWGRDNWLYNASYRSRWREVKGVWRREPMQALGQWGITQDDYGRLFYNSNSDQLRGDFLPSHFISTLDPRLEVYGINKQIAADQSTWPVRPTPGVNRGYREEQLRKDGTLATFTAASAPVIYRGVNFPGHFLGNAFVPEPAAHLVKRNLILEGEGQLTAINAYRDVEFLASTDERFRPVFLTNGPDGALYVVDYYRGILEGYQFATTYLKHQILERGLNRPLWGLGRIYRVVYEGGIVARQPDFEHASAEGLISLLIDENGWTRDTAQRLIVESHSQEITALLRSVLTRAAHGRDRLTALWCLEGREELVLDDVTVALSDADIHVRVGAWQAGATLLRSKAGAAAIASQARRIIEEQPVVLAQAALSLAGADSPAILDYLWRLLPRAAEHPMLGESLLVALRGHEVETLSRLCEQMVARAGPIFGMQPLLDKLGAHIVCTGGDAVDALERAIIDKRLPQLARLALMQGATGVAGAALPVENLQRLSASAPDGAVRRSAIELLETLNRQRIEQAARPPVSPLTPEQQQLFEAGKTAYGLCAGCHQPDGLGRAAVAPSLGGGRWANAVSFDHAIRIVLKGKEGTPEYPAAMVPLQALPDDQIAGILTYVRRSFGNDASAVMPADVARIRSEIASRTAPWTDGELEKLNGEGK
jgi:putative membrane-bound dehydrogenase-like protein